MINVPLKIVKQRIVDASGISMKDLDEKIKSKLEQLAGLITEEGAAQIIANELGVNLMKSEGIIKFKGMIPGMKGAEINAKIIKKYDVREFKNEKRSGKLGKFLAGDETGTAMVVLWNHACDTFDSLNEGDVVKITGATIKENNGRNEIHVSEAGLIVVNPEGVNVDSSARRSNQEYSKPVRKKIKELSDNENNVEIFATIVQVFDPKFFKVDPDSGKRVSDDAKDGFVFNAVMNIFADDGSDNVRVVLWKNQILNLLGVDEQSLINFKDNPAAFEEVKTDLLGMMVKFIGRTVKNEMFGRTEFIANIVVTNVNPDEELKNLEQNGETKVQDKKKEVADSDGFDEELLNLEDLDNLD